MNTSAMTAYSRCAGPARRTHAQATESQLPPLGQSDAFDRAIAEFSAAYADQNERDYQALVDAVNFRPDRRVLKPVCELCGYIRRGATG